MKIEVTTDLELCRNLRRTVFIEEQKVPEHEEWDGLDGEAVHLLASQDDRPRGTARILIRGNVGKIGRVCVLAADRGRGVGAALIRAALDCLAGRGDVTQARLSSQTHAIGFYERLGFVAQGPVYDDAGIPHRDMVRDL